ncbi:MAG TPA: hypothetical protein VIS49_04565 [Cyclobacteriaceae bacterium]
MNRLGLFKGQDLNLFDSYWEETSYGNRLWPSINSNSSLNPGSRTGNFLMDAFKLAHYISDGNHQYFSLNNIFELMATIELDDKDFRPKSSNFSKYKNPN